MTARELQGKRRKSFQNAVLRAGCPQFCGSAQRYARTDPQEKSIGVDNFPCQLPAYENKILKFSIMHKNQKSFLPEGRTAFGWQMERPSRSHRSCWRVSGLTSEASRGHWNFPLSRRFVQSTNPVWSKYRALIVFLFRPQNRYRASA